VEPFQRTYEINEVARLTGLTPARLRVWERRYELVRPHRMANGYRAYTAEQVSLLRAIARLVRSGERIGDLMSEPRDQLLARAAVPPEDEGPLGALMARIIAYDRDGLEALVAGQLALRGTAAFAREIVLPLATRVGDAWALGELPVAGEHLASEVVLHALKGALRMSRGGGPLLVAACLPGERHEWGVLATLAQATELGWRIHYLGADLPVPEIVEAAWRLHPRIVALSTSDPELCERNLPVLATVPGHLPPGAVAVIGGAGTEPHGRALAGYGFRLGEAPFRALVSPASAAGAR
jgi:DNA-binding transcriptional MerR regulator